MKLIGNIIWVIFGGIFIFLEYIVSGVAMCITIVGIPFGIQSFKMALVALWPFGSRISSGARSNGCLYIIMNIIWLLIGGIWIALSHILFGLIFYITIIGIPFGNQHFKLANVALSPFGKDIR